MLIFYGYMRFNILFIQSNDLNTFNKLTKDILLRHITRKLKKKQQNPVK